MKWLLNSEARQVILFLFGLAGITEQITISALGGPAPDKNFLILFGIFALGAPTARGLITAWRGIEEKNGTSDDDGPNDV